MQTVCFHLSITAKMAKMLNILKITPAKDLEQVTQCYIISYCSFKLVRGCTYMKANTDKTKEDL